MDDKTKSCIGELFLSKQRVCCLGDVAYRLKKHFAIDRLEQLWEHSFHMLLTSLCFVFSFIMSVADIEGDTPQNEVCCDARLHACFCVCREVQH